MAKADKKRIKIQEGLRKPITLLFLLGCLFSLVYLYYSPLPIYISGGLAILSLIVTGIVIQSTNELQGSFGLYLFGGRKGIGIIDRLSKRSETSWRTFTEWGGVMSFGLLYYFLFRKKISKHGLVLGVVSFLFLLFFVLPNLVLAFKFISIPGISATSTTDTTLQLPTFAYPWFIYLVSFIGGFLAFMISLIAYAAGSILYSIALAVTGIITGQPNTALLNQQVPGVVPVIPGITIPFFTGILALAVILIVHEFSHGVLARLAKVKIKSIGLLLFGIIPIGAFVEPDEKHVSKLSKEKQDDIFIAGISANFLFTIIFFILTAIVLVYLLPAFFNTGVVVLSTAPGYPAYNIIKPGAVILAWNGYAVKNISSFIVAAKNDTAFSKVSVATNNGTYTFQTNSTGKVGVGVGETLLPKEKGLQNGAVIFIYEFLVLSFVLNFLVATINLLPVLAFDGWRIYKNRTSSRRTLVAISALTVIGLLILALPWIWI